MLSSSYYGMFVYMFLISKEHNSVPFWTLISFRLFISLSEFCILNALGNCTVFFNCHFRASLSNSTRQETSWNIYPSVISWKLFTQLKRKKITYLLEITQAYSAKVCQLSTIMLIQVLGWTWKWRFIVIPKSYFVGFQITTHVNFLNI
jgi:hypothetical protein